MLTLIVAALGIIIGGFVTKFGEQLFDLVRIKLGQFAREKPAGFAKHFRGIRPTGTDVVVFTITAREHLPITDVLYLRFLSWLLREGYAERLVLVVWFTEPVVSTERWEPYWSYLRHCFSTYGTKVEIIDCATSPVRDQPVPALFWRALNQLTSPEYYQWVRHLGIPARALRHMNRARPGDTVLGGMVGHTLQNAHTAPTVIDNLLDLAARQGNDPVLSVLIWELEVDRLAVYYELYDDYKRRLGHSGFTLNPVRGITIRAGRGKPGDNHSGEHALGLVMSPFDQLDRIADKPRRELRGYVTAAHTVLTETYGFAVRRRHWAKLGRQLLDEWRSAERAAELPKLRRTGLEMLFALNELRRQWRPAHAPAQTPAPTDGVAGG